MGKIVLIDGHSIINRAFYGVPDLTNAAGVHTGAVYGFLSIFFKLLDEEKILKYLRKYDSIFLCQKVGFLTELFQEELGISTDFLNACEDMIGNSKRYLTEDAIEVAYSRRWKLVYPEKIKYIKNGEFLDADI